MGVEDTKKVTVSWSEVSNFKAEFEVPGDLTSKEDILDWVMVWGDEGVADPIVPGVPTRPPYEINTDWDSFTIESEPCRGISQTNCYDCTQEQGHDGPCTFPKEGER